MAGRKLALVPELRVPLTPPFSAR